MDTPGDAAEGDGAATGAMRRAGKVRTATLAAATLAAVLILAVAIRAAGEPSAAAVTPPPSAPQLSAAAGAPAAVGEALSTTAFLPPASEVLVLGDSLALSTYAWLADLMPDRFVAWDAVVGRSTRSARLALEALDARGEVPPVIVVSSGTNDLSAASLQTEAERILALAGTQRCVVWADIVRPDSFGDGTKAANNALAAAFSGHPNVIPVPWAAMVSLHPEWLSRDGIHPNQVGNQARAQAFAEAVFSCSPFDATAPVADQVYLPPSAFLTSGGRGVTGVGPSASPAPQSTPSASPSSSPPSPTASTSAPPASDSPAPTPPSTPTPAPTPTTPPTQPPDPSPTVLASPSQAAPA